MDPKTTPTFITVSKKTARAIMDYQMIKEGDRIAVAVSGGKDSLSLLHILRHRRSISPVPFTFEAVHVDFAFDDFDPAGLIKYFEKEGFTYRVESVDSLKGEK